MIVDPGGEQPIAWRSYRACLEDPPDADWLLVVQDDVLPCADLPARLAAALGAPRYLMALFVPDTALTNRNAYHQAMIAKAAWVEMYTGDWIPVVALAWPTALVPDFLAWAAARGYDDDRRRADDQLVGWWANETGVSVRASVPSLFEHPDECVSLTGSRDPRAKARKALYFADSG